MGDSVLLPQIRNLRNMADYRKKQLQFQKALEAGKKVDQDADTSFKIAKEQIKQNVLPMMSNEAMLQNAQEDRVKQYNAALDHLKSIMPGVYAAQVLQEGLLGDHVGIAEFNRLWPGFQKYAANVTNLTPNYFREYWLKYRRQWEAGVEPPEKKIPPVGNPGETGTTDFPPPPPHGNLRGKRPKIPSGPAPTPTPAPIPTPTPTPVPAPPLPIPPEINDEGPDVPISSWQNFLSELYKKVTNVTADPFPKPWRIPKSVRLPVDLFTDRNKTENTTSSGGPPPPAPPGAGTRVNFTAPNSTNPETQPPEKPWFYPPEPDGTTRIRPRPPTITLRPPNADPIIIPGEFKGGPVVPYKASPIILGPPYRGGPVVPSSAKSPSPTISLNIPSTDDQAGAWLDSIKPEFENLPLSVQEEFRKTAGRLAETIRSVLPTYTELQIMAATAVTSLFFVTKLKLKAGQSVDYFIANFVPPAYDSSVGSTAVAQSFANRAQVGRGVHRKGNAKIIGFGIPADPEVRYQQFGSYLIHTPSLRKNRINIKFPSLASHPKIPQTIASEELIALIQDLLHEGKLNAKLYADLSEADKHYFTELAHTCKIGGKLGLSRKEENADMRRFAVLRGEILAGNDAPQIIKELKYLTLKLLNEGKIPKRSAHDLLFEIAVLT